MLYVANAVDTRFLQKGNGYIRQVEDCAKRDDSPSIVICGDLEAEMTELSEDERGAFPDLGLDERGLDKLIRSWALGCSSLSLLYYRDSSYGAQDGSSRHEKSPRRQTIRI